MVVAIVLWSVAKGKHIVIVVVLDSDSRSKRNSHWLMNCSRGWVRRSIDDDQKKRRWYKVERDAFVSNVECHRHDVVALFPTNHAVKKHACRKTRKCHSTQEALIKHSFWSAYLMENVFRSNIYTELLIELWGFCHFGSCFDFGLCVYQLIMYT